MLEPGVDALFLMPSENVMEHVEIGKLNVKES